jgi:hypothetical protein
MDGAGMTATGGDDRWFQPRGAPDVGIGFLDGKYKTEQALFAAFADGWTA